ncbi:hypothetical protein V2J09_015576 [Rumex salicifolius]
MGCASSKSEDTEAVVLCRKRLSFLDDALRQRYAFAEAHVAYLHSLRSVGVSLHHFFQSAAAGRDLASAAVAPSPVLNLPAHRKVEPEEEEEQLGHHLESSGSPSHNGSGHHLSDSGSGSHLHLQSDSEDDDDELSGSEPLHHLPSSSSPPHLPLPHQQGMYQYENPEGLGYNFNPAGYQIPGGGGGGYVGGYNSTMHMNFMKKQPTPSVSYHQKPLGTESIQMGMSNPPNYPYYMPNQNPNSYYGDPYDAGGGGGGYMGYGGGLFSGGPPQAQYPSTSGGGFASSSNRQPAPPAPPPPPPPNTSPWDMLNFFENIETSYPPYTPGRVSRDSREVREEEGIPDLEDEDFQHEVVKEVHGRQKFVDNGGAGSSSGGGGGDRKSYSKAVEREEIGVSEAEALYKARPSVSTEQDPVEYEVHMVDKKVVGGEAHRPEEQSNVGRGGGFRSVSEVVREIQVQFERASASGGELAQILEVGKLPFNRKSSAYQVSSKMLGAIAPSLPSTSKESDASSSVGDVDEDIRLSSRSLSATLQKLYLWEKKLLEEVKVEEKMRVEHDKKVERLQRLEAKGAEAQKTDATRNGIRNLSTKIRISIAIIDKISVKISKLRDEELWLKLIELIQGLARMWKAMLDCHHSQFQAVEGARGLDAIAFSKNSSDAHLESVLEFERELINWTTGFSNWINTQKGYVKSLNEWLLNCIDSSPEETTDGLAPFSPGRAGAPPVFVICHQWAQSFDRLSEKEVVESMRVFAVMVFQFWERDKVEMQQRFVTDKDKFRNLEREDIKLQKQMIALDKKMVINSGEPSNSLPLSGSVVYQSDTKASLQAGLQHIFEAMDRYTSESLKVYEELLLRSEEVVNEHARRYVFQVQPSFLVRAEDLKNITGGEALKRRKKGAILYIRGELLV